MSVINQMLKQLEERGVQTAQDSLRTVPQDRSRMPAPLLGMGVAAALALAGGVAAWQWIQTRKPVVASAVLPVMPVSSVALAASAETQATAAPVADVAEKAHSEDMHAAAGEDGNVTKNELRRTDESSGRTAKPASRQAIAYLTQGESISSFGGGMDISRSDARMDEAHSPSARERHAVAQKKMAADKPAEELSAMKQISTEQLADAQFRKGVVLMQQGRVSEAMAVYEEALRLNADHDAARQALAVLLLEGKRGADAERVLQEGLENKPEHTGFAMLLARLQVEHGADEQATATLKKHLTYAARQADYQAFLAALLQRQSLHEEAIAHYQAALKIAPGNGIWLMGYGISLQAVKRTDDARIAFRQALETNNLSPELRAFVQQRLKEL